MGIFTGTHISKVDVKGRVSLPSDFRDMLAGVDSRSFYIFPSLTVSALEACDSDYMDRIADAIEEQFAAFSRDEQILTNITARAHKVRLDSTGRFILSEDFMRVAGIDGSALFVGRGRRFQVWSESGYGDYVKTLPTDEIPEFRIKPRVRD